MTTTYFTWWVRAVSVTCLILYLAGCNRQDNMKYPISLAVTVVKEHEGLRLKPYHDDAGFPTVGYGHKLSSTKNDPLNKFNSITETMAVAMLMADLGKAQKEVRSLVTVNLTAGQEAALIDLVFNIGAGNFQKSTLLADLNAGDLSDVPAQFRRWVYADGHKYGGLVERREDEISLWEK